MLNSYSQRGFVVSFFVCAVVGFLAYSSVPPSFAASGASSPTRILVIGATAKSSKQIIQQALDRGFEVVGLARRPEAVTIRHERLSVVKGDVYEVETLEAAMTGNEIVISMIAPRFDPEKEIGKVDLFTVGTTNILSAMKKKGNSRFLVASSLAVEEELPEKEPTGENMGRMWIWNARFLYKDMADMEALVESSGLEYVIFRPPFLVEEPMQNDLKVSVNEHSPKGRILAYADFAKFVLDQVESNDHTGHVVGLFSERKLKWGENVDFEQLAKEAKELKAAEADENCELC